LTSGAKVNNLEITFGSLFAGIGGFDLGFERAGMVCKWQVEINDYANRVLAKHWPHVHRERDIRTAGRHNLEPVDVICGGFPCQDISYAGQGAGLDGERSGLFFEAVRVVRELRPRIVVLENVAALLTRGLDRVLGTLAEIGYDAEWHCIPAAAVGAPHERERVFVIAYSDVDFVRASWTTGNKRTSTDLHFSGTRKAGLMESWWAMEPEPCSVVYGIPGVVDRLRGLGNAVVPQVAEWIGQRIATALRQEFSV
jgi:DNA (cytosine-5)-methyltransferase 1